MSGRMPVINCPIMKQSDGSYLTYIVFDGEIVNKVPTHPSQIRAKRDSCLWRPEIKGSTSFIQQAKAFVSALEE
jgi:hypothetical protein